jgi:hypothetical protein
MIPPMMARIAVSAGTATEIAIGVVTALGNIPR